LFVLVLVFYVPRIGIVDEGRERVDDDQARVRRRERRRRVDKERQDVGQRWRRDVVEATAQVFGDGSLRGSSSRPAVWYRRALGCREDPEKPLGYEGGTRSVCSQLALVTTREARRDCTYQPRRRAGPRAVH
jgi:hypothetical protein